MKKHEVKDVVPGRKPMTPGTMPGKSTGKTTGKRMRR